DLIFDSAFNKLDQWVKKGIRAPSAARIRLTNPGTPQGVIATDKFRHGLDGVRTPYIDVPDAVYFTNSPGPGTCREIGHKVPFDTAQIIELYGNRKAFVYFFMVTADRFVQEGWLHVVDANR